MKTFIAAKIFFGIILFTPTVTQMTFNLTKKQINKAAKKTQKRKNTNKDFLLPEKDIVMTSQIDQQKEKPGSDIITNLSQKAQNAPAYFKNLTNMTNKEMLNIKNYTNQLLDSLEKRGKQLENERQKQNQRVRHAKNLIHSLKKKKKNRKLRKQKPKQKKHRKLLFGNSDEDMLKKDLAETKFMFGFVAQKTTWTGLVELKKARGEMKIMQQRIDGYTDNYAQRLESTERRLMGMEEDEEQHDLEAANHEKEEHLKEQAHHLKDEMEHEHEEMLDEKQKMLDEEAMKLQMEEQLHKDLLNLDEEPEKNTAEATGQQINLLTQQMATLQQQLVGLQSAVEDNEQSKISLNDKIKSLMPEGLDAPTSSQLIGDNKDIQNEQDKYEEKKSALQNQISVIQQQVNTMQHQLNIVHQRQEKINLKEKVNGMDDILH